MSYILEVCAANLSSALAAQRAGAHRIELCCALDGGGLTPSYGLLKRVLDQLTIPVNVLIRPREGHFCYTEAELAVMVEDVLLCRQAGAHGIVIGALTEDGAIDQQAINVLLDAARDLDVTFHRAFDFTADPAQALEVLVGLGIGRVLSSGQAASAVEGREILRTLVRQAAGRISVMPGAGLSAGNLSDLAAFTGAREFHLSGRKWVAPPSLSHALDGLEYGYWASDETRIREALAALGQ